MIGQKVKKKPLPNRAAIAGVGWRIQQHEGAVIFTEDCPMYGSFKKFVFHKTENDLWYFELVSAREEVMMSQVIKVYQFLCDHLGGDYSEVAQHES